MLFPVSMFLHAIDFRTVRLAVLERQEQREVTLTRSNTTTTVANAICASDSGEKIKVNLWGDHAVDFYDLFMPGHVSTCG